MTQNDSTRFRKFLLSQPDFKDSSSSSSALPALYADLATHRSSNRMSYDASVDWWTRTLLKACLIGAQWGTRDAASAKGKQVERSVDSDRLILHINQQLIEECTVEEVGRPLGIGTVTMELQRSQRLYPLKTYLSDTMPIAGPSTSKRGLRSMAYTVAKSPLIWAFSQMSLQLGFGDGDEDDRSEREWRLAKGDWVSWDNMQTLTETICSIHREKARLSPLESLYSLRMFQVELVEPALMQIDEGRRDKTDVRLQLSSLDLQVLIKYMSRDRHLAVSDGKVIKLQHIEGETLGPITEEERGVITVKDTYTRLEKQIEELEKRIKERQVKVEACLREKKREQALSYLRSKKMLDELLEKRTKSIETLHGVLLKIEQAASDVEIVKAYELSTSSLKMLLSDARLQPDRIDASMEKMQDTLADADEVRRAIEAGNEGMRRVNGEEELDDEEMEVELKRLEEENKLDEERMQKEKAEANDKMREKDVMMRKQQEEEMRGNKEAKESQLTKETVASQEARAELIPS